MNPELRSQMRLATVGMDDGQIKFARDRAIVVQQNAFSNLRASLHEQLGEEISQSVLFRFGYKNATEDFQRFAKDFCDPQDISLLNLGPQIHTGMGFTKVLPENLNIDRDMGRFYFSGRWLHSYEAEVHLQHYGLSKYPVCFSLCGYGSGWCSEFFGEPVLEIETQCMAQGFDDCKWEIRAIKEWGAEAKPWLKAASYAQKSVYRELVKSKSELMQLNEQLTKKVDDRTEKLELLMRILCHDLKEPLFRLERKISDNFPALAELKEINELLTAIQIRNQYESLAKSMKIEPLDAAHLLTYTQSNILEWLAKEKLTLTIENNIPSHTLVLADRDILDKHIMRNIISNAVKHSPYGGRIQIAGKLVNDSWQVIISDQGMGIPKTELNRINAELAAPEAPENFRLCQTHGIGLKLAAALAHAMNGHIQLDARHISSFPETHGTTCTISLPAMRL